jgi:hypothetical protein
MIVTIVGIDPGKNGGLAAITADGTVTVTAMPIVGKELDIRAIADWLSELRKHDKVAVCIEKVHAMSKPGQAKQGVTSMFTFGKTVGVMYGVIGTLQLPLYEVAPQTWKKVVLHDTLKDKQAAIDYCTRVFPTVNLLATARSRKSHTGIADALCIARYAQLKYYDQL